MILLNDNYSRYGTCFLVLIFPSLCNLVEHSGSIIIVLFMLMGFSITLSRKKRPVLGKHETYVMVAFTAFFVVYLLSLAINGFLGHVPDPHLKYVDHEIRFIFIIPTFFLLRYYKIPQSVLWGSIIAGAVLSGGYAICSALWLAPGARVSGSYHPIAFGDISMALAFMSLVSIGWFTCKRKAYIWIPLIALLLGVVASILSGTRGAWIATPALVCVLFFYASKYIKLGPRLLMVGLCCFIAVGAYKTPATKIVNRVDLIITEIRDYLEGNRAYTAINTRIEGWRGALDIYRQHPILGGGPESFTPLLRELVNNGKPYDNALPHPQPHNAYLSAMVECGTLGLIALLAIFGLPLWSAATYIRSGRKSRDLGYALVMLVIAFTHFGLTESIFARNVNINFYVVMMAGLLAVAANEEMAQSLSSEK